MSFRELAHELNSLLDGSLRSVALALRELKGTPPTEIPHAIKPLQAAEAAMRDMGRILTEALQETPIDDASVDLGTLIRRLVDQFAALAIDGGVNVVVDIEPAVGGVAATALLPAVRNGLRNAIEAAAIGGSSGQVEVLASVDRRDRLVLIISDTGPGLRPDDESADKPDGHGVGLWLSERLVQELGGELSLMNMPFGSGAVWRLTMPMARLRTQ